MWLTQISDFGNIFIIFFLFHGPFYPRRGKKRKSDKLNFKLSQLLNIKAVKEISLNFDPNYIFQKKKNYKNYINNIMLYTLICNINIIIYFTKTCIVI